MAKIFAKNAIVLINGYNFSTYSTAFETDENVNPIDVTGFTDGCKNFVPGIKSASMKVDMLWDSAANSVHAALASMPTGAVTILPEGYVLGNLSLSMPFMQSNYSPKGTPESALSVGSIDFATSGTNVGIERGWALAHATITDSTDGTGFDDPTSGAVTAACGAVLHIWTPCAADTYVVKVQHSTALGSGYADLITFTANGSARTVERQTVASGTVNRYRRVVTTRTGAAANPFGFSVAFYHL